LSAIENCSRGGRKKKGSKSATREEGGTRSRRRLIGREKRGGKTKRKKADTKEEGKSSYVPVFQNGPKKGANISLKTPERPCREKERLFDQAKKKEKRRLWFVLQGPSKNVGGGKRKRC